MPKKVVAVLNDLLFRVKIEEAAKRAGVELVVVQSQQETLNQAQNRPAIIILDLNDLKTEPLDTIGKLKSSHETKHISLLGYVSHVQTDLIQAARAQGCDEVMARSAFSQSLLKILSRYAREQ
ncbi:MAG: hypothetical protein JO182_32840 [Acidobacteriaceae bacterium]|nr:hypothetical protein [Acidobacteriaceae bacterium]